MINSLLELRTWYLGRLGSCPLDTASQWSQRGFLLVLSASRAQASVAQVQQCAHVSAVIKNYCHTLLVGQLGHLLQTG